MFSPLCGHISLHSDNLNNNEKKKSLIGGDLVTLDSRSGTDCLEVSQSHVRSHAKPPQSKKSQYAKYAKWIIIAFYCEGYHGAGQTSHYDWGIEQSRCANSANPAVGGAE